jgi:hypothetical protein
MFNLLNSVGNNGVDRQLGNLILFAPVMMNLISSVWNVMAKTRDIVFRTIPMASTFGHGFSRLVSLKIETFLDSLRDYYLLRNNLRGMWLMMNTWSAGN